MKTSNYKLALSLFTVLSVLPTLALAAEAAPVSPAGGVFKMLLGLAVVLAVMALVTWLLKRMVPGAGHRQSVIKVVGGVSLGTREKVVVLEVSGRWIVVGVASGQVSRLANLESGSIRTSDTIPTGKSMPDLAPDTFTNTFASWLTKSTGKILDKKDIKE